MSSQQSPEIRASDAERERTGDLLREATVEGRLTLDEFSERYMQAQQARTRGELDVVVQDLPVARPVTPYGGPKSKLRAILSGIDQTTPWQLAQETEIWAILGSCKLDLRQATISAEVTTIHAQVILGSLDLVVPPGVMVEVDSALILSGRNLNLSSRPPTSPNQPRIRVTGSIVLGSVNVRDAPNLGERVREVASSLFSPPKNNQQR